MVNKADNEWERRVMYRLTHAERQVLLVIRNSQGCDSTGDVYRKARIVSRVDRRALLSLVARGLLRGNGDRIITTGMGDIVAAEIQADIARARAPSGRLPAGQSDGATKEII